MMRFCAVILVCLVARPVVAQESALELESWCKFIDTAPMRSDGTIGIPMTPRAQYCWGVFEAIQQLSVFDSEGGPPCEVPSSVGPTNPACAVMLLKFCPPQKATESLFIKIFVRYVERHPEQAHLLFTQVALYALTEAFPCASAEPGR